MAKRDECFFCGFDAISNLFFNISSDKVEPDGYCQKHFWKNKIYFIQFVNLNKSIHHL